MDVLITQRNVSNQLKPLDHRKLSLRHDLTLPAVRYLASSYMYLSANLLYPLLSRQADPMDNIRDNTAEARSI